MFCFRLAICFQLDRLKKEKFIGNPFKQSERIYKTGDFGKWLPDGNIQFIGRRDEQIKFNGYRIELHEIKSTLERTDFVEQAECIPVIINGKVKRLIAFVILNTITSPSQEKNLIQELLRKELPDYMIPSEIILLKEFPYTESFKVDKQKLLHTYLSGK